MQNKIIVITGGAKGLGKCMAEVAVGQGAQVVISDIEASTLEATAQAIGATGMVADMTKEGEVTRLAQEVVSRFGKIDIWINNAGLWLPITPLENYDMQKVHTLFEVNVFGTMHGMRAVLPYMKKQNAGSIVNIISTTALDGMHGSSGSVYVASKYAIKGLTYSLREELKDTAIKLFAIFPGGIKTALFHGDEPANVNDFMEPGPVAEKIITHIAQENADLDLILKRPGQ